MDSAILTDEMYKSNLGRSLFIVHDAFVICGFSLMNENLQIRHQALSKLIEDSYCMYSREPKNSFYIILKPFVSKTEFAKLLEDYSSKRSENEVDGLVMYPINEPVGKGTQLTLFKWKEHHTIDFKIKLTNHHKVQLLTHSQNKDVVFQTIEFDAFKNLDEDPKTNDVYEFDAYLDKDLVIFTPILKRNDKPHGNNLYTVKKTLLNVKENIQLPDLQYLFASST
jgi:hypothetical protein